jgi:hypothetical protein
LQNYLFDEKGIVITMSSISKLMNNPLLLTYLAGIYPALFVASNNWFIYSNKDLLFLLLATPVIVMLIGILLYSLLFVSIPFPTIRRGIIVNTFFTVYSCATIFFLLQTVNLSLIKNTVILIVFQGLITIAFVFLVNKTGVWMFTSFICFLLFLACSQWAYSYYSSIDKIYNNLWYSHNKDQTKNIAFVTKPNVYLLVLESYHDRTTLKEIYNYDNHRMEYKLGEKGFILYHNFFANYNNTLASIVSLFTMEHHHYSISIGKDDALSARQIIGAKTYNPVISVFKNNGYEIQYLSHSDYCYLAGDDIDFSYPKRTIFKVFEIYQIRILDDLLSRVLPTYKGAEGRNRNKDRIRVDEKQTYDQMRRRIHLASKSKKPYFTFIKLPLPGHFVEAFDKINPLNCDYVEKLQKANQLIMGFVNQILENDPDPLIIVLGDHGAYRYRRAWDGKKDIHVAFAAHNVPEETVARDLFGVFLAIRYHKQHDPQFKIFSHANLMRYVFSTLCESDFPLRTTVPDESYFKFQKQIFICARNGKALKKWELLNQPSQEN